MKAEQLISLVVEGAEPKQAISGAIFDFLAYLTTHNVPTTFSSKHDAAVAVEHLQKWASKRDLNLDDADVLGWNQ